MEQKEARLAHAKKVTGSSPASAIILSICEIKEYVYMMEGLNEQT